MTEFDVLMIEMRHAGWPHFRPPAVTGRSVFIGAGLRPALIELDRPSLS